YLQDCQQSPGAHGEWLSQTDTLIVSDAPQAMDCVAAALQGALKPFLKPNLSAVAAVNSPMQCMMKEVCAQCLCRHHDPDTKAPAGAVFSCFNHHQPLFRVDFGNLQARQGQNSVQEKVGNQWLSFLMDRPHVPNGLEEGLENESALPAGSGDLSLESDQVLTP
ncbi:MAG TPA: hypothetical protein VMV35_07680, partial [Halothiobacillus sp.]|nr:hypothetical protein [Halothiobacillus sp.]